MKESTSIAIVGGDLRVDYAGDSVLVPANMLSTLVSMDYENKSMIKLGKMREIFENAISRDREVDNKTSVTLTIDEISKLMDIALDVD